MFYVLLTYRLPIQALKEYEDHLRIATSERDVYREACRESRRLKELGLPPAMAHYSFDFAQQFHYPSDPFQPGPVYFLTPRKCALFGICCEAIPEQVS